MKTVISANFWGLCAIATIGMTLLTPTIAHAGEGHQATEDRSERMEEREGKGEGDFFQEYGINMPCNDDEDPQSVPEPSGLLSFGMLGMMGVATVKMKQHRSSVTTKDQGSESRN